VRVVTRSPNPVSRVLVDSDKFEKVVDDRATVAGRSEANAHRRHPLVVISTVFSMVAALAGAIWCSKAEKLRSVFLHNLSGPNR
jgi:hypothetical protein